MGDDSTTTRAAQAASLFAGETWLDPIEAGLRERSRGVIEAPFEEELTAALGRGRRERAVGAAEGYRNGTRARQLLGSFGPAEVSVPRARMVALTGVGIRRSSRSLAVDGDRESGRRLRPGLGGEPEATPEPAVREQVAQPLGTQPDQADPAGAGAGAGPGRGRGAQAAGRARARPRPGCRAPAPPGWPPPAPASAARPARGESGASAATASPGP